jgi:tetratricopeptide (TPR) repeat protein
MVLMPHSDPRRGRFSFSRRGLLGLLAATLIVGATVFGWYWTHRPDYLLRRGQQALLDENVLLAEEYLGALEDRDHSDHALLLKGELLFRGKRFLEALTALSQITDRGELHWQAVPLTGRCLLQLGAYLDAEQTFGYLLENQPDNIDGHRGLAAVYYDLGAHGYVDAHCQEWARLDPNSGAPHRLRGVMLKDTGQFAESVEAFREALSRELPDAVRDEVHMELAGSLIKQTQYEDALAELEKISDAQAAVLPVKELKAEALRALGRGAEARQLVEGVLEEDPDNVGALRLRAVLHLDERRAEQAAALLEKATQLAPRNHLLRETLGRAYTALGRKEAAQAQQREAARLVDVAIKLATLTGEMTKRFRDPKAHEEMAALYDELGLAAQAAKSRRFAVLFQDAPLE